MSKQRPTADKMTNELSGASAFFRKSPPTEPEMAPDPATQGPSNTAAPKLQTTPRTPDRPKRRQMIRHSFEIYIDQLEALRERADGQRERGEFGSMSKMVRDALDDLLTGKDIPSR